MAINMRRSASSASKGSHRRQRRRNLKETRLSLRSPKPPFTRGGVTLPENYQRAWHVRFGYGMFCQDRQFAPAASDPAPGRRQLKLPARRARRGRGRTRGVQSAPGEEVRFAGDSPVEGAGFEPSVPIAKGDASQVRSGLAGGLVAFGPDG